MHGILEGGDGLLKRELEVRWVEWMGVHGTLDSGWRVEWWVEWMRLWTLDGGGVVGGVDGTLDSGWRGSGGWNGGWSGWDSGWRGSGVSLA